MHERTGRATISILPETPIRCASGSSPQKPAVGSNKNKERQNMKWSLIALVLALGAGCATHHQARYESPYPPRVVVPSPAPGAVVVTPPSGSVVISTPNPAPGTVVVPSVTENEAAEIARSEAYRHGWRNVAVQRAHFWDNAWHVDIYHEPAKHAERYGWVDIAPDGTVLRFSDKPREHAGYYRR
jgi:hypothetical protein